MSSSATELGLYNINTPHTRSWDHMAWFLEFDLRWFSHGVLSRILPALVLSPPAVEITSGDSDLSDSDWIESGL